VEGKDIPGVEDPGVTFVIMPLLSLIEDNLNFVKELEIPAITLSGTEKQLSNVGSIYD
jgi:superfamily II DNA helicase RecQ